MNIISIKPDSYTKKQCNSDNVHVAYCQNPMELDFVFDTNREDDEKNIITLGVNEIEQVEKMLKMAREIDWPTPTELEDIQSEIGSGSKTITKQFKEFSVNELGTLCAHHPVCQGCPLAMIIPDSSYCPKNILEKLITVKESDLK